MTYRATWEFKAILLASVGVLVFLAYVPCVVLMLWWMITSRTWIALLVAVPMLAGALAWGYGIAVGLPRAYRISFEEGMLEWVALGTLLPFRVRVRLVDIRYIYQLQPNYGMQRIELVGEKRSWILRGALAEADTHAIMQQIFDHTKAAQAAPKTPARSGPSIPPLFSPNPKPGPPLEWSKAT